MKKHFITVFIATAVLLSCATLPGKNSTRIYSEIPAQSKVRLNKITLEPSHILDGIAGELPAFIGSCLSGAGFILSEQPGDEVYELDVFLRMKKWQHDYSNRESVALRLELSLDHEIHAYRLYTEDTDKSIDSFSWTFSLIDNNIKELYAAIQNE